MILMLNFIYNSFQKLMWFHLCFSHFVSISRLQICIASNNPFIIWLAVCQECFFFAQVGKSSKLMQKTICWIFGRIWRNFSWDICIKGISTQIFHIQPFWEVMGMYGMMLYICWCTCISTENQPSFCADNHASHNICHHFASLMWKT